MKAQSHKHLYITGLYEVDRHLVPIAAVSLSVHYWLLTAAQQSPRERGKDSLWHGYEAYCSENVTSLGPLLMLTHGLKHSICQKFSYLL